MSAKLKSVIRELIQSSKENVSLDDIVSMLKSRTEYQRLPTAAMKSNVKQILEEMKKSSSMGEKNGNGQRMIGMKRNRQLNDLSMPSSINVEKFLAKPMVKLSELGGMDDIVKAIREIIGSPLNSFAVYKEIGVEPVKGILLCGPPGCGKTTLAYAIGGEYNIPFYKITGPDIVTSLSGESEMIIRELFQTVVKKAPSILFIDEIETILGKREQASKDMEKRIVAQIMACIDELNLIELKDIKAPVFVIGATSKPEFIDNSMRRSGRFDREIHIGFPTLRMRKEMLMSIAKNKKIDSNVNWDLLAMATPGYLAADIQSLVRTAGHGAIMRYEKSPFDIKALTIQQCDFDYGISIIQPTSKREGFTTIPNVTWNDIGGLSELREELYYNIVLPCVEPLTLSLIGIDKACGILLYGPPGCGKTLLAKAVANEAKANFISIKGPELLNKYVGESEKAIRSLFLRARNSSPCIIFFDELDALVPKRSQDNNNASERVVNQLLTEMDGLEDRKQIFVIGATNRPDIIDPAMLRPGRLGKLLYVPLPQQMDRLSILSTITKSLPLDKQVSIEEIAKDAKLEGFSGADLASLVREAQMHSIKRLKLNAKESGTPITELTIQVEDLNYALTSILPSVSKNDNQKYESIRMKLKESCSRIDSKI